MTIKAIQETKGAIFYFSCFVLIALMISPTMIFRDIGWLNSSTPSTVKYELWLSSISILDFLLIVASVAIVVKGVLKGYTPIKSIIGIFLYVFI